MSRSRRRGSGSRRRAASDWQTRWPSSAWTRPTRCRESTMTDISAAPFDTSLLPPGLRALDLDALADEEGTPLFVYDEDFLRAQCRRYIDAFGPDAVAYAGKAFLCTAMVRLVAEE